MSRKPRSTSPEAIAKRNAAFAKLSPAQKRVVVAKDVLAALNAKQLKARQSVYVESTLVRSDPASEYDMDEYYRQRNEADAADAQTMLLEGKAECTVCAIGSVFVCAVERMNKLSYLDFRTMDQRDMRHYLADAGFSLEQLDLMECAFERTAKYIESEKYEQFSCGGYEEGDDDIDAAIRFGEQFVTYNESGSRVVNSEGCMRAIMKNIIANNGEFRP
jgi:hypothetical protein